MSSELAAGYGMSLSALAATRPTVTTAAGTGTPPLQPQLALPPRVVEAQVGSAPAGHGAGGNGAGSFGTDPSSTSMDLLRAKHQVGVACYSCSRGLRQCEDR